MTLWKPWCETVWLIRATSEPDVKQVRTSMQGDPEYRVALVSMPFGSLDRPALGISLLKSALSAQDVACDIHYLFSKLVDRIGIDTYRWLTDEVPYTSFVGDWCFTLPLHGRQPDRDWDYVKSILLDTWHLPRSDIARIIAVREQCTDYLDDCLSSIDWTSYQLVGFTSTFTQNIASLALAKALRKHYPHLKIVFGGANWEGDMGMELFNAYPFVDYAVQGEADHAFPLMINRLASDRSLDGIPGLLQRNIHGQVRQCKPAMPVTDMDSVPIPDFSDYFSMLEISGASSRISPSLLMETSRGCWWGAQSHCTFCGLNGDGMAFRSKSATRVLHELTSLESHWNIRDVSVVDNILDMQYFKTLLPTLAAQGSQRRLFYEVKANLTRQQIQLLHDAGVHSIQPGIESLSTHVLSLMRKGTDALRNVQLLKWCKEIGVSVDWNILYGFPGERPEDYQTTLELFTLISHLEPPSGYGPIRLDRFSPYHANPEEYGIRNVRPMDVFSYLYPFNKDRLERMVSYFDFDYVDPAYPLDATELIAAIEHWRADKPQNHELRVDNDGQSLHIRDTRVPGNDKHYQLEGFDRLIYLLCDRISSVSSIHRRLLRLFPQARFNEADIKGLLDWFEERRLILREKEHVLALGVYTEFPLTLLTATETAVADRQHGKSSQVWPPTQTAERNHRTTIPIKLESTP